MSSDRVELTMMPDSDCKEEDVLTVQLNNVCTVASLWSAAVHDFAIEDGGPSSQRHLLQLENIPVSPRITDMLGAKYYF